MKKIFIGMMAIAAITFTATAQDKSGGRDHSKQHEGFGHHRGGPGKHGHGMMMKGLNLTDAQKQQSKSINEDFRTKMQALKKNDNMTIKDFKTQREALMNERKTKMMALLTPDQKSKIDQNKKDMMAKHAEMQGKRLEKMKTKLGLTPDQVSKMKSQQDAFRSKMETLRNDQSLSQDQKKDQFMTLRKEQKENMKSILTPEQLKKMEERRGKRSQKTT